MALLMSILSALIPGLIQEIDNLITNGKASPSDLDAVPALVKEVLALVQKYIPSWAAPLMPEIEQLISDLVAKEVAKLK